MAVNIEEFLAKTEALAKKDGDTSGRAPMEVYEPYIQESSIRHNVDPDLLRSQLYQESRGDSLAVSHAGAQGVMQFMPATAKSMGLKDPFVAKESVDAGAKLMRQLLDRFDGDYDKALAAYNAGPSRVVKYGGVPPFKETQNYVKEIKERTGDSSFTKKTKPPVDDKIAKFLAMTESLADKPAAPDPTPPQQPPPSDEIQLTTEQIPGIPLADGTAPDVSYEELLQPPQMPEPETIEKRVTDSGLREAIFPRSFGEKQSKPTPVYDRETGQPTRYFQAETHSALDSFSDIADTPSRFLGALTGQAEGDDILERMSDPEAGLLKKPGEMLREISEDPKASMLVKILSKTGEITTDVLEDPVVLAGLFKAIPTIARKLVKDPSVLKKTAAEVKPKDVKVETPLPETKASGVESASPLAPEAPTIKSHPTDKGVELKFEDNTPATKKEVVIKKDAPKKGKNLYKDLTKKHGQKKASEMLRKEGYTGINYPAGTATKGGPSDSQNFVVFTDEGVDIIKGDPKKGLKVFHGSPHKFDKFSMENIGTGEGAQAFGHGLYFTDNPKIAGDYARKLPYREVVKRFRAMLPDDADALDVENLIGTGYFSKEQDAVLKALKEDDWLGHDYPARAISDAYGKNFKEWFDPSSELVDAIEKTKNVYEVSIPKGKYLDWDKDVDQTLLKKLGYVEEAKKSKPSVKKFELEDKLEKIAKQTPDKPSSEVTNINQLSSKVYDIVENAPKHKVKKNYRKRVKKTIDDWMQPISSRLEKISPKLKHAVKSHAFRVVDSSNMEKTNIDDFLQGVKKLEEGDKRKLNYALSNKDLYNSEQMLKKHGLEESFKKVKSLLEKKYKEAKDAGYDIGKIEDYFPRSVKDYKGLMKEVTGDEKWTPLKNLIAKETAKADKPLDPDEVVDLINKYFLGTKPKGTKAPGFTKERSFEVIPPELFKYYDSPEKTLVKYIDNMNQGIATRNFFGKNAKFDTNGKLNVTKSIGGLIQDLSSSGKQLDIEEEDLLLEILSSYLNPGKMGEMASAYRNMELGSTLGNIGSIVTQTQDVAYAMKDYGVFKPLVNYAFSMTKNIPGLDKLGPKTWASMEQAGITKMSQEFAEPSRSASALNVILKPLSVFDRLGKETFINTALQNLQKRAVKNTKELYDELKPFYGKDSHTIIKDLQRKRLSDPVRQLLFHKVTDITPTALTEMPLKYLKMNNGKILYTLKSYQVKHLDVMRQSIVRDIVKAKTKEEKLKNTGKLLRFAGAFVALGMNRDKVVDFMMGREDADLEDHVVENILKLAGISRFIFYQAKRESPHWAALKQALPPFSVFDGIWKDYKQTSKEDGLSPATSDLTQRMPWLGKLYYWNFGKGSKLAERYESIEDWKPVTELSKVNREIKEAKKNKDFKKVASLKRDNPLLRKLPQLSKLKREYSSLNTEAKENPKRADIIRKKQDIILKKLDRLLGN